MSEEKKQEYLIRKDGANFFRTPSALHLFNDEGKRYACGEVISCIQVYLCPGCDLTHMEISFIGGAGSRSTLAVNMHPQTAEALARVLTNPPTETIPMEVINEHFGGEK